jgi:hypothetical protein
MSTEPAALVDFVTVPQWVAWRNEMRNGKITKVPYCSATRQAEADDASTWLPHDQAVLISEAIVNGSGGGIGIELGQCGKAWIAGIDLDTCRNPVSGTIEPWASAVIDRLNSYAEVSPSETGVKAFFLIDPTDVPKLRLKNGTPVAAELETLLRTIIKGEQIDIASLDPFIKTHSLPENSNDALDFVCTLLASISHTTHQKASQPQAMPTKAAALQPQKTPDASFIPSP